ncbi:uncharacterized protein Dwil_GK14266 [Drosophila willistoni]|uniref:DUF4794 domain-containing protein n=2 Tax=Drosophila willistoni TaxID=7260 RepID=B4NI32_DROWI|nr:uncharacterized protein Dwil_GK14266 [Drosophila willistoni]
MSCLLNILVLLMLVQLIPAHPYGYKMIIPTLSSPLEEATSPHHKLILQSPALDHNIYMDYVVTSKPLHLRKYNKNGSKTKKTKKDSKIYYIPIPPLPFRHIPGIGLDYQPMKIKPLLTQEATSTTTTPAPPTRPHLPDHAVQNLESKLFRVQHIKDYYFNGHPYRLQVAHANRHTALTPLNLKSNFYYNKNIIH